MYRSAILTLLLSAGVLAVPAPETDSLLSAARSALSENRYLRAIELLEELTSRTPDDVEAWYWLGIAYWDRDQGPEAIHAYRQAIAADPNEQSIWSLYALENLAEVYTRTGRLAESREMYLRARKRETRPEWLRKIADQLDELDLTEGRLVPDEHTILNERGEIIGGIGPSRMRTNRNFEIARHTNDPRKEAEYYRKAIDTDPGMYQPYFNLGLALVHLGRYREAIPWLERSDSVWREDRQSNPDGRAKTDAHAFLTLCYVELGDLQKAEQHAAVAATTGEYLYWERLYNARLQVARNRPAEALAILEPLLAGNPEHAETLHAAALAHAVRGDTATARDLLETAIRVIPDNHPWMTRLKTVWRKTLSTWSKTPPD